MHSFYVTQLRFFLGVNTPDHSLLYANLISHIKSKVTPYVAHLKPKASCSTLRHIMQSIANQLNDCVEVNEDVSLPTTHCTLSHIEKWYYAQELSSITPVGPRVSS